MSPKQAIDFVKHHGVVLQSSQGPVPNLAEQIAGEPIQGSWWGHPKSRAIFRATQAVSDDPDTLVCKLINDRVTYVHRRLWPALVKLSERFGEGQIARVWDEHTDSGRHVSRKLPFPEWVPDDVMQEAQTLSVPDAEKMLSAVLPSRPKTRR